MPTTQRLLTDETGQALVTAVNNIVAAVKPNATEIQMSSSDTTTVATAITNINDKIGTVPSGQTVEGQITTLNSNLEKKLTVEAYSVMLLADTPTNVPVKAKNNWGAYWVIVAYNTVAELWHLVVSPDAVKSAKVLIGTGVLSFARPNNETITITSTVRVNVTVLDVGNS